MLFPSLDDFGPTRATLHRDAQLISSVARAHAPAHPRWWHISLTLRADGLTTDPVPLPDGGLLTLRLDFLRHALVVESSRGFEKQWPLSAEISTTTLANDLFDTIAPLGLTGPFARDRFESDDLRRYDPDSAERFFSALTTAYVAMQRHRVTLDKGIVSPIQLWPHNFDMAFDWLGTRMVDSAEDDDGDKAPAQLNLGFYPGGTHAETYFYSNPWPFDEDAYLGRDLPSGASWHTDGWNGTILPYDELLDDEQASERVTAYASAVADIVAPHLFDTN